MLLSLAEASRYRPFRSVMIKDALSPAFAVQNLASGLR